MSIGKPEPIISCHQPGDGSPVDDAACADGDNGIVTSNVNVNVESKSTDEQLVARIADGNKDVEAFLRAQLGMGNSFQ